MKFLTALFFSATLPTAIAFASDTPIKGETVLICSNEAYVLGNESSEQSRVIVSAGTSAGAFNVALTDFLPMGWLRYSARGQVTDNIINLEMHNGLEMVGKRTQKCGQFHAENTCYSTSFRGEDYLCNIANEVGSGD